MVLTIFQFLSGKSASYRRWSNAYTEQQEVDFLIANEREPFLLVESKLNYEQPAKALLAAQRALRVPAVQLLKVAPGYRTFTNDGLPVLVAPACQWCAGLPVVRRVAVSLKFGDAAPWYFREKFTTPSPSYK